MAAGYRWFVGDLRTGRIYRDVDLDGSWSTPFDDSGSLSGSFPLRSGEWLSARADASPAKSFLAVAYVNAVGTETFLAGGPIWTASYTDSDGKLSIGASGLASYFDHRKVLPVLAAGESAQTATLTYTGAQLGLVAKQLVALAQSHTAGNLPIVLPDDADLGGAGTAHTRTYPGYELATVGERLKDLSGVIDGPEIQFVPRRRTDDPRFIEWVMRIGVEANGMMLTQSGSPWVFDRQVSKSPVISIDVASDGSTMADRVFAAGQGEGEGRPIEYVENTNLTDLGWPLLESEVPSTDTVSVPATLTAHAGELLAISSAPIETYTLKLSRDAAPNVGQYAAGDWALLKVAGHPYLPDADYRVRILNISGDSTAEVTVNLAPRLAG